MSVACGLALSALLGMCVGASYSDLRYGLVKNNFLAAFAVVAVLLAVITYVTYPETLSIYVATVVIGCFLILALYFFHVWAGGDAKFACVATMLYPVALYPFPRAPLLSVMVALALSFVYGVTYVATRSLIRLVRHGELPEFGQVFTFLLGLVWSCSCSYLVIALCHVVYRLVLASHIYLDGYIVSACGFCAAWVAAQRQVFKKRWVLAVVFIIDLVGCCILRTLPLSFRPYNILLVLTLALSRLLLESNKYQSKEAHAVKRGDILSIESTVLLSTFMQLDEPLPATEDLRSRLTEEQALRVREWNGEVSVVEKTPFVIFISLGYLSCAVWGMMQL